MFGGAIASAAAVILLLGITNAVQAMPSFDTFGPLPQFTGGGTGIPNDAFAISTADVNGISNAITIGLSATQRFFNPALTNDGAGTFFAGAGSNFGDPNNPGPSTSLGSTWNFNFFVSIDPGIGNSNDFIILLNYDFNPAVGNAGDTGTIDLALGTFLAVSGGLPVVEGSQNLLFGFLAGVPALPFVAVPGFGPFDPNAGGTYEFELSIAENVNNVPVTLASVAIDVVVEAPEPGTLALLGIGLLGLGAIRRRKTA